MANEALYRLGEDFEPKVMQYLVDSGVDEGEAEREAEKVGTVYAVENTSPSKITTANTRLCYRAHRPPTP